MTRYIPEEIMNGIKPTPDDEPKHPDNGGNRTGKNTEKINNLPYWQINVLPSQRTQTCPEFLLNLTEKDRETLSIPDAEYQVDSWETVKRRVADNKLDEFKRIPSQLRAYLEYTSRLKREYPGGGGVKQFILRERLGWDDGGEALRPRGRGMFECEGDVKVLRNDWPYGIDGRIVHLIVWTKFGLGEDPETGGVARGVRGVVDEWVRRRFTCSGGGHGGKAPREDQVIWFKNWSSIKSIHSVEHFHVMLFDPDPEFVDEVTGGDVPLWKKTDDQRKEEGRIGGVENGRDRKESV